MKDYVEARLAETDQVPAPRRRVLDDLAARIAGALQRTGSVDLVFICTHNSRRSHLGQVWAAVAARRFGLAGVRTWSGGTEATAFAAAAIAALQRTGVRIDVEPGSANPVCIVRHDEAHEPLRCWSKRFDDPSNPGSGFVALMMCSSADAACPAVPGAALRVAIPHPDPKDAEGSSRERQAYDEVCAAIAREMLHVMRRVAGSYDVDDLGSRG